jgi:LmbE family N-acetylglucosaminyl deacetylase
MTCSDLKSDRDRIGAVSGELAQPPFEPGTPAGRGSSQKFHVGALVVGTFITFAGKSTHPTNNMRILYILPHPDDESFGPAGAICAEVLAGNEVFLLTLTKGGATKVRIPLGLSIEEMGAVREKELECAGKVLGLAGLTVLDLPDSGLKEMDPREIELIIEKYIREIRPQVLVTYPVHGVSGFHDHLVAHAVVKRVFLEMKANGADYLKRLAFLALEESAIEELSKSNFRLNASPPELVDCVMHVSEECHAAFQRALDCYKTYQETIAKSNIRNLVTRDVAFEIFQERFDPPLTSLTERIT